MHFWPPMFTIVVILAPKQKKCNFNPLILQCLGKYALLAPYLYKKVAILAPFLGHVAASQYSSEN